MLVEHYVDQRVVLDHGRQRLPRPGAERAAAHGGGVRRHRQGPQRRALRRRGQLGRRRPGRPARGIEHALKSGDSVLVQVTKDPVGHKGLAPHRQISLPGRFLVYVPDGSMTRHQPQAAGHRAHPAEGDPQGGRPRGRRRHRAHGRRGRLRGGAAPRRRPADRAVGGHRARRRRPPRRRRCCTASPTSPSGSIRDMFNEDFDKLVVARRRRLGHRAVVHRARRARPRWTGVALDARTGDVFADAPRRRADRQGAGPQGLAAVRRLAGHRPHRGDDGRRRQHRQVHRRRRQPRGDGHPQQPRGRRGDRPSAPAARHRRHHRHRLHRHGARVQPRPRAAPADSSAWAGTAPSTRSPRSPRSGSCR